MPPTWSLVGKLRRNLLVGVCFAMLFDEEPQQGFRLPWLNILRRMEDLEHSRCSMAWSPLLHPRPPELGSG